jgi:hypothetical protein
MSDPYSIVQDSVENQIVSLRSPANVETFITQNWRETSRRIREKLAPVPELHPKERARVRDWHHHFHQKKQESN